MSIEHDLDQLWIRCFGPNAASNDESWPGAEILDRRLLAGASPDWIEGIRHVHKGEELRNKGSSLEALAQYGLAFAQTAPALDLLVYLVIGFASASNLPAAEAWGRRLLDHGGANADVHLHLCIVIWNSGRQLEALALCDIIVSKYPDHLGAICTAANFYLARAQSDKALDACLSLLVIKANALRETPHFFDVLARASVSSDRSLPPSCLAEIETAAADPAGPAEAREALAVLKLRETMRIAWGGFFGAEGLPSLDVVMALRETPRARLENACNNAPAPVLVSLTDAPALARLYGGEIQRPDALEVEGFRLESELKDPTLPRWVKNHSEHDEPNTRLQLSIIAQGAVRIFSPFGDIVRSASSFVASYQPQRRENGNTIFYYFHEPRPLFVIVATETMWPMAWYDPVAEIVLMHGAMFEDGFKAYMRQSICDLRYILLHDVSSARRYLDRDRERQGGKVTILFGVLAYLSTHILDIQGFARLRDADLLDRVGQIVLTAPEPLGTLEEYYPAVPSHLVQRPRLADMLALNSYLWQNNAFSARVTGCVVEDSVARAVLTHAQQKVDHDWKREVDEVATGKDLVLFVALRTSSRKWISPPEEIANVFNALHEEFPSLALIFDGFSSTVDDPASQFIKNDLDYISSISKYLRPKIKTLVAAGRSLPDSIYAADASDMHLSGQGTSATKGLLIASKPGVILSPRQFGIRFEELRRPKPETIALREQSLDAIDGTVQTDFELDVAIVLASLVEVARLLPKSSIGSHSSRLDVVR